MIFTEYLHLCYAIFVHQVIEYLAQLVRLWSQPSPLLAIS